MTINANVGLPRAETRVDDAVCSQSGELRWADFSAPPIPADADSPLLHLNIPQAPTNKAYPPVEKII